MWKPYKYFVLAMPKDNPGLERSLQRSTNYVDTAIQIKMRWDVDQGIESEVYQDHRYKAKLRLYNYLLRKLPFDEGDFYFCPSSDQRQGLREDWINPKNKFIPWNNPKNKFIPWKDFLINAEIKYRIENNIKLSVKL